jgi:hypothetical protein
MGKITFKALFAAALVGVTALTLAAPAQAGRGWGHGGPYYYHHGGGGGDAWAAGLLGLGVGAIIGSALTPQTVYVAPPPPPAYAPAAYGPPPWTPDWYSYCYSRYRTFNPNTGYFVGYDGVAYFCR